MLQFMLVRLLLHGILTSLPVCVQSGTCRGVIAMCMEDGTLHRFKAHNTILATGG